MVKLDLIVGALITILGSSLTYTSAQKSDANSSDALLTYYFHLKIDNEFRAAFNFINEPQWLLKVMSFCNSSPLNNLMEEIYDYGIGKILIIQYLLKLEEYLDFKKLPVPPNQIMSFSKYKNDLNTYLMIGRLPGSNQPDGWILYEILEDDYKELIDDLVAHDTFREIAKDFADMDLPIDCLIHNLYLIMYKTHPQTVINPCKKYSITLNM